MTARPFVEPLLAEYGITRDQKDEEE